MDFVARKYDFSPGDHCIVIGEIGVNHNCDEGILFRLIDEGIKAGLDVIKLQRFNSALEISEHAALADYQARAGMKDSQLKMAQELELPDELLIKAFEYCKEKKIGFFCTAFERESVDFLADRLGCKSIKVPSPEISNKPVLEQMARKFDSLLVSTGASYLEEVERALGWIRAAGKGRNDLSLMHCTSQYPASLEQANLKAITTMRDKFQIPVGYSDHTLGHTAAVVSTGLGSAMIEKHYTLDKSLPGPDHQASADIAELTRFINAVREASKIRDPRTGLADINNLAHLVDNMSLARASIGDGVKRPTLEEEETRPKIRKSVVCGLLSIPAGTILQENMVEMKRPWVQAAIEPFQLESFLGCRFLKEKSFDEPIFPEDLGL